MDMQPRVHLNPDVFYNVVDLLIDEVKQYQGPLEYSWQYEMLSHGRTLRLVDHRSDSMLRPIVGPVLELVSNQQACQLFMSGLPNRASVRSLTIHGGIKMVYLFTVLNTLGRYLSREGRPAVPLNLQAVLLDYRNVSRSSIRDFWREGRTRACFEGVIEAAIVCPSRPFDPVDVFSYHAMFLSVERLALHGLVPWQAQEDLRHLAFLVLRWMPTSDTQDRLVRLLTLRSLKELVLVHSSLEDEYVGEGVPLTSDQKLEVARSYPHVTISEVQPPVLDTNEIAAWFAEQVRNETIWTLKGVPWLEIADVA